MAEPIPGGSGCLRLLPSSVAIVPGSLAHAKPGAGVIARSGATLAIDQATARGVVD